MNSSSLNRNKKSIIRRMNMECQTSTVTHTQIQFHIVNELQAESELTIQLKLKVVVSAGRFDFLTRVLFIVDYVDNFVTVISFYLKI